MNDVYTQSRARAARRTIVRSWPVRAIALLLLGQAGGLVGISISRGARIDWQQAIEREALSPQAINAAFIGGTFVPLAILGVLAALGLLLSLRAGWLLAMIVQIAILLVCLYLYVQQKPGFVYPIMLSGIILVLYLNSYDVRVRFDAGPASRQPEPPDA